MGNGHPGRPRSPFRVRHHSENYSRPNVFPPPTSGYPSPVNPTLPSSRISYPSPPFDQGVQGGPPFTQAQRPYFGQNQSSLPEYPEVFPPQGYPPQWYRPQEYPQGYYPQGPQAQWYPQQGYPGYPGQGPGNGLAGTAFCASCLACITCLLCSCCQGLMGAASGTSGEDYDGGTSGLSPEVSPPVVGSSADGSAVNQ